jgi:cullin 4
MQAVESMCVHKFAEKLYQNLKAACDEHTRRRVASMSEHLGLDTTAFLKQMDACWHSNCDQMTLIRSIFLYLDRAYVAKASDTQPRGIYDMGLQQFRKHLESQPQACTVCLLLFFCCSADVTMRQLMCEVPCIV